MIDETANIIKTQSEVGYTYSLPTGETITTNYITTPSTYTLNNGILVMQSGPDYAAAGEKLVYYIVVKNTNATAQTIMLQSSLGVTAGTVAYTGVAIAKAVGTGAFTNLVADTDYRVNTTGTTGANTSIIVNLGSVNPDTAGQVTLRVVVSSVPTSYTDLSTAPAITEYLQIFTGTFPTDGAFDAVTTGTDNVKTEIQWATLTVNKTIRLTTGNTEVSGNIPGGTAFYYQLELSNNGNLDATTTVKDVLEDGMVAVAGTNNPTIKVESSTDNVTYDEVSAGNASLTGDVISIQNLTVGKQATTTPGKLYVRIYFTAK